MIIRIELVNARQVVACWAFLCRYRDFYRGGEIFINIERNPEMRKNQRLINYHTSGEAAPLADDISLGEIAVQHNASNPRLYIKLNDGSIGIFEDLTYIQRLEERVTALENGIVYYSVSYELEETIASVNTSRIASGDSLTMTLSPAHYYMDINSVTVTMHGVDVTSSVYSNGSINIPAVDGDVVIRAASKPRYLKKSDFAVSGGTASLDNITDLGDGFIAITFTNSGQSYRINLPQGSTTGNAFTVHWEDGDMTLYNGSTTGGTQISSVPSYLGFFDKAGYDAGLFYSFRTTASNYRLYSGCHATNNFDSNYLQIAANSSYKSTLPITVKMRAYITWK